MIIKKQIIPLTNYEIGRRGKTVNKVVIHWFGLGKLAGADAQFKKVGGETSAHYGIEDATVYQWVDEKDTAYHAGNFDVNLESIGIEHSAEPGRLASDQTYETSAQLISEICTRYNIIPSTQTICPHKQFKSTQCPGTMDLPRIISRVLELMGGDMECEVKENSKIDFNDPGGKRREVIFYVKGFYEQKALKDSAEKELTQIETELGVTKATYETIIGKIDAGVSSLEAKAGIVPPQNVTLSERISSLSDYVGSNQSVNDDISVIRRILEKIFGKG